VTTLNVVPIYEQNSSDIVAMLRQSADSIESETDEVDKTVAEVFLQVTESGEVIVYGWGDVHSKWHTIGILHSAIAELV